MVLGCYDGEQIFILDIEQKELEGVEFNLLKLKVNIIWPDVLKKEKSIEMVSLKLSADE